MEALESVYLDSCALIVSGTMFQASLAIPDKLGPIARLQEPNQKQKDDKKYQVVFVHQYKTMSVTENRLWCLVVLVIIIVTMAVIKAHSRTTLTLETCREFVTRNDNPRPHRDTIYLCILTQIKDNNNK